MQTHTQYLLRVKLPPGALLYASRFRELLAKSELLPNEFFHVDANRRPIYALPNIRVVGGRGWVGVLAGEAHRALLYNAAGPAIQMVSRELRAPVSINVEEIELGASPQHVPFEYWLREVVIRRRRQWVSDLPLEKAVERTILNGLESYAQQYGIDLPTPDQLELGNVEVTKHRYLNIETRAGVAMGEHAHLIDAKFTLFARLKGHWVVGSLQSRGYGRIGVDLNQLAVNLQREERTERRFIQ
jgi:hypothetical protein